MHEIDYGEGQTKRPRAHDKGNGRAHSTGKSMVDHDKWLQVGFRNRFKQQGEWAYTPPRSQKTPNTHQVCTRVVSQPWMQNRQDKRKKTSRTFHAS